MRSLSTDRARPSVSPLRATRLDRLNVRHRRSRPPVNDGTQGSHAGRTRRDGIDGACTHMRPTALARPLNDAVDVSDVLDIVADALREALDARDPRAVVFTDDGALHWRDGKTAVLPDDVATAMRTRLAGEVRGVTAAGADDYETLGNGCVLPVACGATVVAAVGFALAPDTPPPGADAIAFLDMLAALAAGALARVLHARAAQRLAERLEGMAGSVATLREQLVERDRLAGLGVLLAGVVHDLGNPISSIAANVGPLEDELVAMAGNPTRPDVAQGLERSRARVAAIRRGATRLVASVRDLRAISRAPGLAADPVDVGELIALSVRLLEHRWPPDVALTREGPPLPRIAADPSQLSQVLVNLLANACDAVDGHGTVSIRTLATPDAVVVEIGDDGCGIAPEHLPHVFEPFFTTKDPSRGTGLGLAISRRIAEIHGGRLDVDSTPDRGSVFKLTLPRRRKV